MNEKDFLRILDLAGVLNEAMYQSFYDKYHRSFKTQAEFKRFADRNQRLYITPEKPDENINDYINFRELAVSLDNVVEDAKEPFIGKDHKNPLTNEQISSIRAARVYAVDYNSHFECRFFDRPDVMTKYEDERKGTTYTEDDGFRMNRLPNFPPERLASVLREMLVKGVGKVLRNQKKMTVSSDKNRAIFSGNYGGSAIEFVAEILDGSINLVTIYPEEDSAEKHRWAHKGTPVFKIN